MKCSRIQNNFEADFSALSKTVIMDIIFNNLIDLRLNSISCYTYV